MAENVVSRAEQGLLTPNPGQPRQAASSPGGQYSRESQGRQPLGAGACQRCTGTYPSGQQVKAEFVLTGAQVNDALEVRGTEPYKHGRECQQKAPGAHEAAKWSSAASTFPPPHQVFAQALPSAGFPDRISPFLKLCANAFSSRKPSLKSHLHGDLFYFRTPKHFSCPP